MDVGREESSRIGAELALILLTREAIRHVFGSKLIHPNFANGPPFGQPTHRSSLVMSTPIAQPQVPPRLQRLTPVMIVDDVETCLEFWVSRLGFVAENQVPGDDGRLVFASAKKGDIEVMYQTRASVLAERPSAAPELVGHSTVLFISTDDLDAVERALDGAPVVSARHATFYGSIEIYVKEPGGNTVGFAQFA